MAISSPITGVAVTGLTSPTYTFVADKAPNSFQSQIAITALGGTQSGVDTSASSRPFTVTVGRPQNIRQLNAVDSNNVLRSVPNNVYTTLVRKGVTVLAGQPSKVFQIRSEFSVPAGADVADVVNIKAAYSCFGGFHTQGANDMVNLLTTGVMAVI